MIRHVLRYVEMIRKEVMVEVEVPKEFTMADVYAAARAKITAETRLREGNPHYWPHLQFISSRVLGEVPNVEESIPVSDQSSDEAVSGSDRPDDAEPRPNGLGK